jgi:hypothetical protein
VRDAVGGGIVHGVVHRDPPGIEPCQDFAQIVRDAADVRDDLGEMTVRLDVRLVEAADDRDPIAAAREEERGVPGHVRADDQVERRVVQVRALAREDHPAIESQLVENPGDLLDLLADQGIADAHRVTSWVAS